MTGMWSRSGLAWTIFAAGMATRILASAAVMLASDGGRREDL